MNELILNKQYDEVASISINPQVDSPADNKNTVCQTNEIKIIESLKQEALAHNEILNTLLNELKPIDFHERADLASNEAVSKKEYLILTIEEILSIAEKNNWSLCITDGSPYLYNGEYWKKLQKNDLIKFLGDAAIKLGVQVFTAKYHQFKDELYKQFIKSAYVPKQTKKNTEVLINLRNGTFVVNPENQYLKPFYKTDFLTYQLGFEYVPAATAPLFKQYLDRVLPDEEQQNILAEYVGNIFIKQNVLKLEKILVLFGGGANGKSVFFEIINALLGEENVSNYSLQSLTNESGYQRAKLADKLLNYASEISTKMDSTLFKLLASCEPIEARLPYQEPFLLTDYAKIICNTNILPKDVEQNDAFFRRFLLIHFKVTIPEHERDNELAKKIIGSELPGIFNWILNGLKRLLKNRKFTNSTAVDAALKEYKLNSDSVHLFLNDAGYIPDTTELYSLKSIFDGYKQYCKDFGYVSCSMKSFSERMKNLNFHTFRKSKGMMVYAKICKYQEPAFDTHAPSDFSHSSSEVAEMQDV